MLYFDRLYHKNFETVHQQFWSAIHFALHIELVLMLQGVAMLILWLVALQGLEGAEARLTAIQGKTQQRLYATGADLVGDFRGQLDAFIWKRVPKGVDASKGLEYWNQSLILLGDSYNFLKQDNSNMMARDALDGAFKKAETIAIQTLFDSLGISIPKEEDAENTKSKTFSKDELLEKYEDRFKLVFDYVYISVSTISTSCTDLH
jgi:hypothetical protein